MQVDDRLSLHEKKEARGSTMDEPSSAPHGGHRVPHLAGNERALTSDARPLDYGGQRVRGFRVLGGSKRLDIRRRREIFALQGSNREEAPVLWGRSTGASSLVLFC